MHAENVARQPEYQEVPLVRGHLAARQHEEPVRLRDTTRLASVQEPVVVGYAYAVQARLLGPQDQLAQSHGAVVGRGMSVRVEVYYQSAFRESAPERVV